MSDTVTITALQRMKDDGRKITGVVAWDYQVAAIADAAGVEIVSVGDSVGVNLWGHRSPLEVTLEEMLIVGAAVRRGTRRALVSVDIPFGPVQEGTASAVRAAIRLAKEAGADLVKIDGAGDFPEAVTAVARAGIPVWAQLGITPQTALRHGVSYAETISGAAVPPGMTDELVTEAKLLEEAGAALLDFQNSGPVAGAAVTAAVGIPVIGGAGGGPWLDGRVRLAQTALGSAARTLDAVPDSYVHVAQLARGAFEALAADVRAGRHIKGDGRA